MIISETCKAKNIKLPASVKPFSEKFVFHLYVSFLNREEAIGLDILEGMSKIAEKLQKENFILKVRLSQGNPGGKAPRWDENFIKTELTPFAGQIQRIWACGPPIMNETFDRSLEKMRDSLSLKNSQIDIL